MKNSSNLLFIAAACLLAASPLAFGENGTWSVGGNASASGTWNTSDTNWTGVTAGTPWDSTNGATNNAIFSPTAARPTITVSGTVYANSLTLNTNQDLLTASGNITLAGTNPTVNVTTAGRYIFVQSSTAWGGAPAFTKTGAGIFGWQGSVTTGNVTVDQGWVITQGLSLTGAAGTPRTITVNTNSGGGFSLQNSGGNVTFSNLSLILNAGRLDFSNSANRSTNAAVQLNNTGANFISFGNYSNFVGADANAMTMTGNLSGTGGFTLQGYVLSSTNVPNNGTLTLSSTSNSYQGDTGIQDGILRLGASNVIPDGASAGNLVMNAGAARAGSLNLNGFNETINGLSGTTGNFTGQIYNGANGTASTLTVGANNATSSFAGVIKDNVTGNGTVALSKTGNGTQTLSGTNTYTGSTTISAGTLLIAGGNINGTSGVSVSAGATFTNNSATSFTKNLTITEGAGAAGSAINGSGAFAAANLTIGSNLSDGFTTFALGSATLTKGGTLALTLSGITNGSYTLFSGGTIDGAFTGLSINGFGLTSLGDGDFSGTTGGYDYTFTNSSNLLTVIPEPSSFAMLLGGMGMLALLRRRRAGL